MTDYFTYAELALLEELFGDPSGFGSERELLAVAAPLLSDSAPELVAGLAGGGHALIGTQHALQRLSDDLATQHRSDSDMDMPADTRSDSDTDSDMDMPADTRSDSDTDTEAPTMRLEVIIGKRQRRFWRPVCSDGWVGAAYRQRETAARVAADYLRSLN